MGCSPANITSPETIQDEHSFITSLSSAVALHIPGRLANFKDERDWTAFCQSSLLLITTFADHVISLSFVCCLFVFFVSWSQLLRTYKNISYMTCPLPLCAQDWIISWVLDWSVVCSYRQSPRRRPHLKSFRSWVIVRKLDTSRPRNIEKQSSSPSNEL